MSDLHTNFTFPSDPDNVSKLESFVDEVALRYALSPDVYGNILISLTEAVTNAIRHGNRCDSGKCVSISLHRRHDELSFRVADEGPGFDPATVADPTCSERIAECGGRGLFLMRNLSDECKFMRGGSMVEMRFKIERKSR